VLAAVPSCAADGSANVEAPPLAPAKAGIAVAEEAARRHGDASVEYPIMDRAVYDELVEEIGEETACQMLNVFVEEAVAQLAVLHRLCCQSDCPQIERLAHALKGTAGTFGLERLAALARSLELGASGMIDAEFHAALNQIERAFDEARAQLPPQSNAPNRMALQG
jgi:HPt (histidine-containing phosphotransfer) domain-containing protein